MPQAVECLLCKSEALSSNPSPTKKKTKKTKNHHQNTSSILKIDFEGGYTNQKPILIFSKRFCLIIPLLANCCNNI
jgi:hypothetical protein